MTNDATISRFNKGSEHYQTDSIKYRKLSADRVSQLAAPASTDVILDIGCGTGTQLIGLAGMIKWGRYKFWNGPKGQRTINKGWLRQLGIS